MIPEFPHTNKFPYTSEAEYEFHTATNVRALREWITDTRKLDSGQSWYVAEMIYVMRRAGYSIDDIRTRFIYLLPRKADY